MYQNSHSNVYVSIVSISRQSNVCTFCLVPSKQSRRADTTIEKKILKGNGKSLKVIFLAFGTLKEETISAAAKNIYIYSLFATFWRPHCRCCHSPQKIVATDEPCHLSLHRKIHVAPFLRIPYINMGMILGVIHKPCGQIF